MKNISFQIKGDQILLFGSQKEGIVIGSLSERLQQAKQNVEVALAHKEKTAVFFGIEHLPLLQAAWPKELPAIIIEKSQVYAQFFCNTHGLNASEFCSDHQHLILGEIGFLLFNPTGDERLFREMFYFEEATAVCFALNKIPDACFQNIMMHHVGACEHDLPLLRRLEYGVHLVALAKSFHRQHQNLYDQIASEDRTPHAVALLNAEKEDKNLSWMYGGIDFGLEISSFPIGEGLFINRHMLLFVEDGRDHDTEPHPVRVSDVKNNFIQQKATQLIQILQGKRPQFVFCRNRSIFNSLAESLFYEEILTRTKTPVYFFFMDIVSQMTLFYQGAWSIPYSLHRKKSEIDQHFQADPVFGLLGEPSDYRNHRFPLFYSNQHRPNITAPVNDPSDCEHDIVFIHGSRLAVEKYAVIKKMYALVDWLSQQEGRPLFYQVVYDLRHRLRDQGHHLYLYHQMLLNSLETLFYALFRLRGVPKLAKELSEKYKVKVFGRRWEEILPAELCGGHLEGEEAVQETYRKAKLTINVSLDSSYFDPNPNVIDCLKAGGLPLVARPSFTNVDLPDRSFRGEDHLLFYDNHDQLKELVDDYLQHWDKRQAYIKEAQNGWLKEFLSPDKKVPLQTLLNQELNTEPYRLKLQSCDQKTLDAVQLALTGYLHALTGTQDLAEEAWSKARQMAEMPDLG